MNERGQIDMWRFVRWAPNLSTADYHLLMSTAVCVSPRFSLVLCRTFFLLPWLCAGPEWPVDHRCAVNWETHTSVIKAVGGLVLYQFPFFKASPPVNPVYPIDHCAGPVLPLAVLSLSNDAFSEIQGLCPSSTETSWGHPHHSI